jgi:hypothetical protein
VKWLVLVFIASLAIPALTRQWSDRQNELQVKQELWADIRKASAGAVYGAVRASRARGEDQRSARADLIFGWLQDRVAIEPRFDVYFDDSRAAKHWFGRDGAPSFRDAMLRYVHLACCDAALRERHLTRLRQYLSASGREFQPSDTEKWAVLSCGPQESCPVDETYSATYQWLGNQLLDQRHKLLDQLLHANGEGYSTGWRDFITDLNPLG